MLPTKISPEVIPNGDQFSVELDPIRLLEKLENNFAQNVNPKILPIHDCDVEKCELKYSIHFAAQKDDYVEFENLLSSPAAKFDFEGSDCQGMTILHRLIAKHHADNVQVIKRMEEVISWFVSTFMKSSPALKTCVNKQDSDHKTALHYAASLNLHGVIELLLLWGADPSMQDGDGATPLHVVSMARAEADEKLRQKANPLTCAKQLMDAMPFKDIADNEGRTSLEVAVTMGWNPRLVQLLLDNGCSPCPEIYDKKSGPFRRPILHHAIDNCYDEDVENVDCVRNLIKAMTKEELNLKSEREPKWLGRSAIHMAAYDLSPNVLKALMERDETDVLAVDDSAEKRTTLHILANLGWNAGTGECVEVLLDKKGKIRPSFGEGAKQQFFEMKDANGETALDISIRRDSAPLSKAFIQNAPYYAPSIWMDRDLMEKIYHKVPEALLPVMEEYINFDNKNYEANDETFTAHIGPITGFNENVYEDDQFPDHFVRETDLLAIMMDSPFVKESETANMLQCPLLRVFIMEKWKLLRPMFWIGLFIKIFWIVLYLYFVIDVFWIQFPYEGKPTTSEQNLNFVQLFCAILIISMTSLLSTGRIVVSILSIGIKKALDFYVVIHLVFSVFTCTVIILVCVNGVQEWSYVATAINIIFASFLGMWELRNVPVIGIYADVFFTATKNLIRLMIAFTPLFVGFTIAISLMLRGDKNFPELHWNFVKMLVMMLGEINFNDLFYGSDPQSPFRTFSILMMALFVVTVPIVMFNLLLGFTISDVQALESESENKVLLSQLEEIILLERLVLSRGAQKLLPQRLLWKAMLATRKWTTESEYFGQKLEIETPMEQLPSNLKIKILHVANIRKSKKENN